MAAQAYKQTCLTLHEITGATLLEFELNCSSLHHIALLFIRIHKYMNANAFVSYIWNEQIKHVDNYTHWLATLPNST
jgi:hypothetical protein